MRVQLRPFYASGELAAVYPEPYDHTRWPDHVERVAYTARMLREMGPSSVADLSCGDGAIVKQAGLSVPCYLGDYHPGPDAKAACPWTWNFTGPIERGITEIPLVDVFVCSETLEHVENPDWLLRAIREKARRLLLTTPCGERDNRNPQHYWGWDVPDLEWMLTVAGWSIRESELFTPVSDPYYTFQVWRCS